MTETAVQDRAQKFAIFGDVRVPMPEGVSPADVREVMSRRFPELSNAVMIERQDGSVEFQVTAGEKG